MDFEFLSTTLKKLKRFFAAYCEIIDSNIVQYLGEELEALDLSGNFITTFSPHAFQRFTILKYLNLSHTFLHHFDLSTLQYQKKLSIKMFISFFLYRITKSR